LRLPVYVPSPEPGLRNDLDNEEAAEGDCGVRNIDREGCASAVVLVTVGRECSTNAPGTLRSNSMLTVKLEIGHTTRSTLA
jgi:hypothetical protein